MARKKLPEDQVMQTVGIKLPGAAISDLEELAKEWDAHPSAVGREMLLLGLAVYKATQQSGIFTDLIWRGTLSKEELRSQFSRILGEATDTSTKEGSKVITKATEDIPKLHPDEDEDDADQEQPTELASPPISDNPDDDEPFQKEPDLPTAKGKVITGPHIKPRHG